ncbi:MAG: Na+/H+ antiporter NhaA [Fibrobacteria bacterium]
MKQKNADIEFNALGKVAGSFRKFLQLESSSGILLLAALAIALAWANSPWSDLYFHILELPFGIQTGTFTYSQSLHHWINDGLMTLFFFVVGLEIKREVVAGELASLKRAAFPMIAALGGMVVPALIYSGFNHGHEGARGWGIPMATDIPFALGILALLGNRVPNSLKVFLMALAIIDDLGSILVIAIFYTQGISWVVFGYAAAVLGILIVLGLTNVRRPVFYAGLGIILWYLLLRSGIHGTIAGVLVAWTIPAVSPINEKSFASLCRGILGRFEAASYKEETPILNQERLDSVMELERACEEVEPPLQRMEESLHPWTSYLILPLFALANAGVRIDLSLLHSLFNRAGIGIFLGLVVGKPLGIFLASWAALALGFPALTGGVRMKHIIGVGMLGGIGFTMSIFVSGLAFGGNGLLDAAKVTVFLASLTSGISGWLFLRLITSEEGAVQNED